MMRVLVDVTSARGRSLVLPRATLSSATGGTSLLRVSSVFAGSHPPRLLNERLVDPDELVDEVVDTLLIRAIL